MTRRSWITLVLVLAAIGAAGAYARVKGTDAVSGVLDWWSDLVPPAVAVVTPQRGPAVEAVYATGSVEPVLWAKVAPTSVGRIIEIRARDGDRVKKGDVLARLDDRSERAKLAELEARASFLREDLDRHAALAKRDVVSQRTYDQLASDYAQARAAVDAARQKLAEMTLVAPLEGQILRQDGEVGEVVDKDEVLFWVGKARPLRIVAEVDEEDIPLVSVGQKVLIKADAYPGQVFEGTVAEITLKGDPIGKNYRVRVALPETLPLLIGMTTEVNIVAREKADALLVPFSAVREGAVFVVEDGRARRRPVTSGILGEVLVEISEGLKGDEKVIADPPAGLKDGARVRVTAAPAQG